jgi:hypothetical protein
VRRVGPTRSGVGLERHQAGLPVGAVTLFAGDLTKGQLEARLVNQGWLPCDGRQVLISAYPVLNHVLSGLYRSARTPDGSFCVPDYRGQFLRGVATEDSQDPGLKERTPPVGGSYGTVGSTQEPMVQMHQHYYQALADAIAGEAGSGAGAPSPTTPTTTGLLDIHLKNLSGDETRPTNIYVHYLIKAADWTRGLGVPW